MDDSEDKPQGSRELVFLAGADDLKTKEQRDALTGDLVDMIIEWVQEDRKRQGLPPLT
jgi:hypothetical protein